MPTKRVFLVFGAPGAGKTFLADRLADSHSFSPPLSVDVLYVQFIEAKAKLLYCDALNKYIGPHYDSILKARDYSIKNYGRDFVNEWHDYVTGEVLSFVDLHERRRLLEDCRYKVWAAISQAHCDRCFLDSSAATNRYLVLSSQMLTTIEQVATLGSV